MHLESLIASIKNNGLLQPIVVRISNHRFQIVAGNRRYEACRRLHWVMIPCLVREFTDKEAFEIGLIENMERKTLTPIEEAIAFQKYVQKAGWGGVTELARAIGRSKEFVSHRVALLRLPTDVLDLISTDKVAPSSANELVWMEDANGQQELAKTLAQKKITTSRVRDAVKLFRGGVPLNQVIDSMDTPSEATAGNARKMKNRKFPRLLDKSVLTFRICMVRLDSIIEELESDSASDNLRKLLIQKRLLVHNQIDELIQLKQAFPPYD